MSDTKPVPRAALERAIRAMESGTPYKEALESLLLEIDDDAADLTMQLQREARGAWLVLLRLPRPERRARALIAGNALSGTSIALAALGFDPTLLDPSETRLRFAELRNRELSPEATTNVLPSRGSFGLPFGDGELDLVVLEAPLAESAPPLAELQRVCGGELVLIADNRLAYKRSTGRRGKFDVPGPLRYAAGVVARSDERTLAGYRDLCSARGFARPRAFALYPHSREFTFVCGLDEPLPRLVVGPKERRNRWKVVGRSLGLFPVLAPSFALISARSGVSPGPSRAERLVAGVARASGEPEPRLEHLVATRGNSAVLLTRHGAEPRDSDAGWWCLHLGLSSAQRRQLGTHARFLRELRARFPRVPVPELLFEGEIEGVALTCERRARGLTATQLTGDPATVGTTLADLARILPELVVEPPRPLGEQGFERLVARRFEIVARHANVPSTLESLARLREEARKGLLGRRFPLVVQHADLRSKHVQVDETGRVLALLDWGSAETADLPYFDLVHYLAHERKQADGLSPAEMGRKVRERDFRPAEREALDRYAAALGLDEDVRRTLELVYPVLVAAMAERHWDYSRPRWLHRQFGI